MGKDVEPREPKQEMSVTTIRNGTVIDHIESDSTFKVADILRVEEERNSVVVAANLPSKRADRKGIIKIENRNLTPQEVNKIALIAPEATLNIISGYKVVEKMRVKLPERIEGIVRCFNPQCVTNQQETTTRFEVVQSSPPALRCLYCERVMQGSDIILK